MEYPDGRLFTCELCGKAFISETFLNKHMEVHSDQNRFQCRECDKHFSRKYSLKRHILAQNSEKTTNVANETKKKKKRKK